MTNSTEEMDFQAILAAVEDYYRGWYEANVERMKLCLHQDLAKRAVKFDQNGQEYLRHLTKEVMVNATREGGGSEAADELKTWKIALLDRFEEIATVKVTAGEYIEYIHLVKQAGRWQVLNVLWTDRR